MFTLRDMQAALLGAPEASPEHDLTVSGVATDSRSVKPGEAFFCIEGDNYDGHQFAAQAVKNGAAVIVASRLMPEIDVPVIMVRDTVHALGRMAAHRRMTTRAKVVAITGTAGKTTVKEMLASVCSIEQRVSKNSGNLNNQIGLPLSIFRADPEADVWVLELGISRAHDMNELGLVALPDMAVIHNIGPAHLEGLGDLAGVARAKASLLNHLQPDGIALVNRDYELLWEEALAIRPDAIAFSTTDKSADYFCTMIDTTPEGRGRFRLVTPALEMEMNLPVCGAHHAENLAAVAAAAHHLGLSAQALIRGTSDQRAMRQRFSCKTTGAVTLIDDSYNANPKSMLAAMQSARDMAGERPLVLVLGDMKELGEHAVAAHVELGRLARSMNPTLLLFQGAHIADVAEGYGNNGTALVEVSTPSQSARSLLEHGVREGVVLVKGSRSCRMEEHAAAITQALNKKGERA